VRIGAHHHFWRDSTEEDAWIGDDLRELRRDFLPAEFAATVAPHGIDGVITVQARQ
jgi:predicted TIM-barrel fold metal-dependent hydrolase